MRAQRFFSAPILFAFIGKVFYEIMHGGFSMNEICGFIKEQAEINFINLETALRTYDRNALVCGAPCWRYAYTNL